MLPPHRSHESCCCCSFSISRRSTPTGINLKALSQQGVGGGREWVLSFPTPLLCCFFVWSDRVRAYMPNVNAIHSLPSHNNPVQNGWLSELSFQLVGVSIEQQSSLFFKKAVLLISTLTWFQILTSLNNNTNIYKYEPEDHKSHFSSDTCALSLWLGSLASGFPDYMFLYPKTAVL